MNRKVFISFLGTSNYGVCDYHRYVNDTDMFHSTSRYAQVVTLKYLMQNEEWTSNDVAYILMTTDSETKNWEDGFFKDRDTNNPLPGLRTCLKDTNPPFSCHPITKLPDGNNENEIWHIFQRIFNECIQENDELYFDITHGYRYLPTLTIVLGNYAKFLRNVTVKSITYCNYEISERGTKPGLIVDLLPFTALQDWTYAAGQYIRSGDASQLEKIGMNTLRPLMKKTQGSDPNINNLRSFIQSLTETTEDFRTCRGINITKANNIKRLNEFSAKIDANIIPPLEPVLKKMQQSLAQFHNDENVMNGFHAASWCYNHGLFQQAATILQENIVTAICMQLGIDWQSRTARSPIYYALGTTHPEPLNTIPQDIQDKRDLIEKILADNKIKEIKKTYINLSTLRNDFNHAGMRENALPPNSIKKQLNTRIQEVFNLFSKSC